MLTSLARSALAVSAVVNVVAAQSPAGRIAVAAGTATDINGVTSSAITVAPSMTYRADASSLVTLGASGTRFTTGAWSLSGLAGFASRTTSSGPFALTFDGSASYTGTSYESSFASADALPAVEASVGALRLFAGAHGALAHTSLTSHLGGSPIGGLNDRRVAIDRNGASILAGGSVGWTASTGERIDVGVREERGRVADSAQTEHGASISLSTEHASFSSTATFRRRGETREYQPAYSAALSLRVSPVVSLDVAAGKYASNPMTGAAAGNFANAGLSFAVGGSRERALPRASDAPALAKGKTRLSIKATDAKRVEVAGDFTKWELVGARRASNGVWYVDLSIPPGEYRYAFRVDGGAWQVPDGVPAVQDDFGGRSAWLVVPATTARRDSSR